MHHGAASKSSSRVEEGADVGAASAALNGCKGLLDLQLTNCTFSFLPLLRCDNSWCLWASLALWAMAQTRCGPRTGTLLQPN